MFVLLFILICLQPANSEDKKPEIPILAKMVGFIDPPCQPRDCCVRGNYCYVAGGLGGIVVLDVSDPVKPKQVAQQAVDGFVWKIKIYGRFAFVAAHDGGFLVYEMPAPTAFIQRGKLDTPGRVFDFALQGNIAFLADGDNGLVIIDVSNPDAPVQLAQRPCADKAYDIALNGKYAYLACGSDGLHIYDINNPSEPKLITKYKSDRAALDVSASGNYVFLSDPSAGLLAIDVTDPLKPKETSRITMDMLINPWVDGEIRGNYLFGACLYGGLEIVDISEPAKLKLAGRSNTTGPVGSDYARSFGVELHGNYAYMSTYYAPRKYRGLQVLELDKQLCQVTVVQEPELPFTPRSQAGGAGSDAQNILKAGLIPDVIINQAISAAGASRANLSMSVEKQFRGAKYRLPDIERTFNNPFGMEKYARDMCLGYDGCGNSLGMTLLTAFHQQGMWYKKFSQPDFSSAAKLSLENKFQRLYELDNKKLPEDAGLRIKEQLAGLPDEVKQGIGILLDATAQAARLRREAFAKLTPADWQVLNKVKDDLWSRQPVYTDLLLDKVDFPKLLEAAVSVASGVDSARPLLVAGVAKMNGQALEFELDTPSGLVAIGGMTGNAYLKEAVLIIDLGGNDVYASGAGSSARVASGISLVMDLSGDDLYISREKYAQGAGVFGVGMLVDCAGDDRYNDEKSRVSFVQGSALAGIGLLWDDGGNDSFYADSNSQGAAHIGVGMLVKNGGSDYYYALDSSQGFGSSLGLGILLDKSGNDRYVGGDLYPDDIRGKMDYSNFCQGAGHGNRTAVHRSKEIGIGMAGGIGVLMDFAGNDSYSAGGFAQGTAYWDALGLLIDVSGDDSYRATEYAQGGCVHVAAAGQFDFAGNDAYRNTASLTLGTGKDYSIGVHIDTSGDDSYDALEDSMGMIMGGGVGLFIDGAGNDTYNMYSHYPGRGDINAYGGAEENSKCAVGIFLDLAGDDTYKTNKPAPGLAVGDGNTWSLGKMAVAVDK